MNDFFGEGYGRLGNQLFQLALLFAARARRGYEFYLPHRGASLWDCFQLDVAHDGPECTHAFEEVNGSCNYDPLVFEQPDGTCYHGYFQSYRYLESCKESLIRFLRFDYAHRALSRAIFAAYRHRHRRPLASLHVRRGDYVQPGAEEARGNLAAAGYYERAVAMIGDDVAYLVFSDDLDWCRRSLALDRVEFVDTDAPTSLSLMTLCDVNVVANSSFSWWAPTSTRARTSMRRAAGSDRGCRRRTIARTTSCRRAGGRSRCSSTSKALRQELQHLRRDNVLRVAGGEQLRGGLHESEAARRIRQERSGRTSELVRRLREERLGPVTDCEP